MLDIRPCPLPLLLSSTMRKLGVRPDRDRELLRIHAGVWVHRASWDGLAPWDRYLTRVYAVAATLRHPTFCLESAAVLQSQPIFGEPSHVHLVSRVDQTYRRGGIEVHGFTGVRRIVMVDGFSLTDAVTTATDLGRVLSPAYGLAVADATARMAIERGADVPDLAALGRAEPNRRGRRRLDWIAERITPLAESPGESVSRAAIEWLGYETPDLQVTLDSEGVRDRADFRWRDRRVIGESDGWGKYDLGDPVRARALLENEKRREDRLRRGGHTVARWEWADVMRVSPLDAKLRSAGLRPVRMRDDAMLATLATVRMAPGHPGLAGLAGLMSRPAA